LELWSHYFSLENLVIKIKIPKRGPPTFSDNSR
jgi:hypothetical protein